MSQRTIVRATWLLLASGCSSVYRLPDSVANDAALIPGEELLEMTVDGEGVIGEVEFHTTLERLPEAVRKAIDAELAGGTVVGCEKEYHGSTVYWEVEKSFGDLAKEVMFTADGKVVSKEFQIRPGDAPRAVMDAADRAVSGGQMTSVEEVTEGGRKTYHVKKEKDRIRYKLIFTPEGELLRKLRELRAEIELPVR